MLPFPRFYVLVLYTGSSCSRGLHSLHVPLPKLNNDYYGSERSEKLGKPYKVLTAYGLQGLGVMSQSLTALVDVGYSALTSYPHLVGLKVVMPLACKIPVGILPEDPAFPNPST